MDRTERFFTGMIIVGMIILCAAFTMWMLPDYSRLIIEWLVH